MGKKYSEKVKKKDTKSKIGKSQNRSKIFGTIFIILVIVIIGIVASILSNEKGMNDNYIKNVSYNEYLEEIKKDNYTIVLLSKPNCYYCAEYKPLMNKVLKELGLNAININVNLLNDNDFNELHESISILKKQYNEEGKVNIPTPATIIFKNGKEVDAIFSNIGDDGLRDFLVKNGVVDR